MLLRTQCGNCGDHFLAKYEIVGGDLCNKCKPADLPKAVASAERINSVVRSALTEKDIEGLKHLCRFLAKYHDDLCKLRFDAATMAKGKADDVRDLLLMEWPVIQGLSNQLNLTKIGEQEVDYTKVNDGVHVMLKGHCI